MKKLFLLFLFSFSFSFGHAVSKELVNAILLKDLDEIRSLVKSDITVDDFVIVFAMDNNIPEQDMMALIKKGKYKIDYVFSNGLSFKSYVLNKIDECRKKTNPEYRSTYDPKYVYGYKWYLSKCLSKWIKEKIDISEDQEFYSRIYAFSNHNGYAIYDHGTIDNIATNIIDLLLKNGYGANFIINSFLWHPSYHSGHSSKGLIELLLKYNLNVNDTCSYGNHKRSLLFYFIYLQDDEVVELLIKNGCDVNQKCKSFVLTDSDLITPLNFAFKMRKGCLKPNYKLDSIIRLLVSNSASLA